MYGLFLALIYIGWKIIANASVETACLSAASFLYGWYFFWTIVLGLIVGILVLCVTGFTTLGGIINGSGFTRSMSGGIIGGLSGFILGGGVSFLLIFRFIIKRILLVVGAYLLMTSGVPGITFAGFSAAKLIVGSLMLFVAVIVMRRKQIDRETN